MLCEVLVKKTDSNNCNGYEEERGMVYRFLRSHKKVKHKEALVGGGRGRVYMFWGGYRKVEYLKVLVRKGGGSDNCVSFTNLSFCYTWGII